MGPIESFSVRVGDVERNSAITALGEHMTAGRLDIDEYGRRSAEANAARTVTDLQQLFVDLPAPHPAMPGGIQPFAAPAGALREKGHRPSVLGIHADLGKLISGLKRRKPDLVFNLAEMFGKGLRSDVGVAGVLDLIGVPYTGGGPGELYLRQDKGLAKKALAFDQILYPDFAVFSRDDLETGGNLRMPLFVKPLCADASIGIGTNSLVRDSTALMERVLAIHKKFGDAALAEEYIEGREFYVGVLGNRDPLAFPPIEMDFSGLADGAPHILDR